MIPLRETSPDVKQMLKGEACMDCGEPFDDPREYPAKCDSCQTIIDTERAERGVEARKDNSRYRG